MAQTIWCSECSLPIRGMNGTITFHRERGYDGPKHFDCGPSGLYTVDFDRIRTGPMGRPGDDSVDGWLSHMKTKVCFGPYDERAFRSMCKEVFSRCKKGSPAL